MAISSSSPLANSYLPRKAPNCMGALIFGIGLSELFLAEINLPST